MTLPVRPVCAAHAERLERLRPIVQGMAQNMRPADEDMLSAGLVKLWEMIARETDAEDRYLIAAARNAMIDRIRYQKVRDRGKRIAEVCGLAESLAAPAAGDPLSVDVDDLLGLLPARLRRAFELHCLRDYTLEETARELGTSTRTVKRLVARARAALREELA